MQPDTLADLEGPLERLPVGPEADFCVRRERTTVAFRATVRRQRIGTAVQFLLVIPILLVPLWGPTLPLLAVLEIVGLLVIGMVVTGVYLWANWRCPGCDRFLGSWGPRRLDTKIRHCPYCGCDLR